MNGDTDVDQLAIVDAAARGDHDAFALLAERSADRLFATATLILRDRSLAQDAVQDRSDPRMA